MCKRRRGEGYIPAQNVFVGRDSESWVVSQAPSPRVSNHSHRYPAYHSAPSCCRTPNSAAVVGSTISQSKKTQLKFTGIYACMEAT